MCRMIVLRTEKIENKKKTVRDKGPLIIRTSLLESCARTRTLVLQMWRMVKFVYVPSRAHRPNGDSFELNQIHSVYARILYESTYH